MSAIIQDNCVIFSIPNSEAIIDVQRTTEKVRTVGSFYLSQQADAIEKFLNNLEGNFYIDLASSYLYCKDAYQELINNCKSIYNHELFYLEEALKDIEWASRKTPEILFFKTNNPIIIEKRKYLKLPSQEMDIGVFKALCLGEVSEIVFEKLSSNSIRIFVRPKKEAMPFFNNIVAFKNWLKMTGKIK